MIGGLSAEFQEPLDAEDAVERQQQPDDHDLLNPHSIAGDASRLHECPMI